METAEGIALFHPRRYALIFGATMVGLLVLGLGVRALLDFDLSNAGLSFLPFYTAAMIEAQKFVKRAHVMPPKKQIWKASFKMALIGTIILTVVGVLALFVGGSTSKEMLFVAVASMVIGFVFGSFGTRWFYHLGGRSILKAEERKKKQTE